MKFLKIGNLYIKEESIEAIDMRVRGTSEKSKNYNIYLIGSDGFSLEIWDDEQCRLIDKWLTHQNIENLTSGIKPK